MNCKNVGMPSVRADQHRVFDGPFIAMAHRGGALLPENIGIENTVTAFRNAVALGYRWLETDVHATADGQLIAFHDSRLDRVTDMSGEVDQLPWSAVRRARIQGEPIPTLDELFETFPEARFNIDIKAPGAIEPLVRAIDRHRAQDRVCVGSFGSSRLREFRRLIGTHVATSAVPEQVLWNALNPLPARIRNRWVTDPSVALQVPTVREIRGVKVPVFTKRLARHAHTVGKQVHVWTIDDADIMHDLIDAGADGIITDRPDVLRAVLTERGLW